MQRRKAFKVAALLLVMVVSSADILAQKRIRFQRGKSSATVRGPIGANGYTEYVIDGRAGQVMTIEITSGNGAVVVNAGTASGKSFSVEMTGGDHLLSVVNTARRATNFTLTVSIR
ncbi:MAG TPA: hypothetical protein VFX97_03170 [Pyrinomonadaceae bacterium]|nr:hypothetical protein [Pyrinomonadaceae bacterium]